MFCRTGRVPLEIADLPCFTLDRVSDNWCNEAAHLLDQATAAESDNVLSEFVQAGQLFVLNLAAIRSSSRLRSRRPRRRALPAGADLSLGRDLADRGAWQSDRGRDQDRGECTTLGVLISEAADILDRNIGEPADFELGCRLSNPDRSI
jgi:enoyl-CoA hydratase / 3-hydroxyacyl-CoA dehydrogenase